MSFWDSMVGFFSGEKKSRTRTAETVKDLKETEEIILKKQGSLQDKINQETETARKNRQTNKIVALQALRRRTRYINQISQLHKTLSTIEGQREQVENTHLQKRVFQAMKGANKTLKSVHQSMDADKVHDVMEDYAAEEQQALEIAEAIGNPGGLNQSIDDADLEKELEELDLDDMEILEPQGLRLPDVPKTKISSATEAKIAVQDEVAKPRRSDQGDAEEKYFNLLADWAEK